MKKRWVGILLTVVMAGSLIGCGGNKSAEPAPEAPAETSQEETEEEAEEPESETPQEADGEKIVLRFATDLSEDYVSTVSLKKFAEEVNQKTNGRIEIDIYAGGQLGEEASCIEQVQMGALDLTKSSMGALTSYNETLSLVGLPYLFKSTDHMWAALNSEVGQEWLDSMAGTGMVGLGWIDTGSRCYYSVDALESVEDFKGVKIRTMTSSIYVDAVEALGATAVTMPANDVYSALQTGVVAAAENVIPAILDRSHQELCNYLLLDAHNYLPEMILVSESVWNGLSAEDQEIILECVRNFEVNHRAAQAEADEDAIEKLKEAGLTVIEVDETFKAELRAAEQSVYDKYGEGNEELIEKIESLN